jgi:diguanylate cyclase (GGDEF)-like protein
MDSKIGLVIQISGVFLITVLLFLLTGSLKSSSLKYWKKAWLTLSLSLISLQMVFMFEDESTLFLIIYYLGEYIFCFFLIAGCRNYASNQKISERSWFWLIPGLIVSLFLTLAVSDFNFIFNLHSLIIGTGFLLAFLSLRTDIELRKNLGWKVMSVALLVLAIDFYHYTVLFTLESFGISPIPKSYLAFNPIIDLVSEILLGFGMIIALLEKVRQQAEEANNKLHEANQKLEQLSQIDPLTALFNRHAFYSFLQKHDHENLFGCVGVFDIDNLKPINDQYGHSAGDLAISLVAHSIRQLIRADDLLFRWGGDEFFVIMVGFDQSQAMQRMQSLDEILTHVRLRGFDGLFTIGVSVGFADFKEISELEKSIKIADEAMYRNKQRRKQTKGENKPKQRLQRSPVTSEA